MSMQSQSSSGSPEAQLQHAQPRVRRRNRLITSCLECRRRKLKCDKISPCTNCTKTARLCVFIASGLDAEAQAKLAQVKEKMGMLERSLEEDVTSRNQQRKRGTATGRHLSELLGQEQSYSDEEEDEETKDLNPSIYATTDAAYYDNDANDELVDLGISMGKMRISERIGGLVRPRFSEELSQAIKELPQVDQEYLNPVSVQDPREWLAPSKDYIAPSCNIFFSPGPEKVSVLAFLPARPLVDKLIAHYWEAVHVIARTVHRPTFDKHYERFWMSINAGMEPRSSFQAVVFAAMLSSVISMPDASVLAEYGVDKQSLVENFRQGTEAALATANFLRTTKLETLQAFVMYLIPICRNEISRAHAALTGMCIRLAECMSLHRDPTNYTTSPVEIHVRRMVWHQICFLDLRNCEATGPRPQIRPDDYDTKFPLNIDDVDLERADNGDKTIDVTTDRDYFTDMTITRMRFECCEMHRIIWNDRPKLDLKRTDGERRVTLTSQLSRIQAFKAAMEKRYVHILSKTVPLHVLAAEIYGILSARLYILLLQKYITSDKASMPPRLRQLCISSAVIIIEHAMNIEKEPAFAAWSWYSGALNQYHVALLLLSELHAASNDPVLEVRVWRCMDFAFGMPPGIPPVEKTRFILKDLISKTEIYARMTKLRAPSSMPHVGPRVNAPGYQARQREQRERSGSMEASGSVSVGTGYASTDATLQTDLNTSTPPPNASTVLPVRKPAAYGDAVPNVDWGSIELPSDTMNTLQQPVSSMDTFDFNDSSTMSSIEQTMPHINMPAMAQVYSNDAMNPGMGMDNRPSNGTTGSSPMNSLNEIDWNDIEKMFGGPDVGSGMMIPPYSFPHFEPGDLQWTS